tara:strand:+ start:3339 stop:5015 length:1677 start_codon:yes stop_codon:yes gene_type:complete
MPITEKNGQWYWGKQGPFDSRNKAEEVAQAAYASGYQKSMDVFSNILQKLEPGWVYDSEFPAPKGSEIQTTPQGTKIWRKFTPRGKTAEEKTAMSHAKTTVGNHIAESDLPRDSKILDFGAGRGTQSRRLQGIGEYSPNEKYSEHAPKEPFTNVHSYDTQPPYDDKSKLDDKYDAVMASNVLNVQSDDKQLTSTLDQLKRLLNDGGHVIANFPSTPNKHEDIKTPNAMESRLKDHFGEDKVEKIKARHWKITKSNIEDNMNSYKDLQNFYKESYDMEKAQKVKNPWAVARAIVDGTARKVGSLWDGKIDPGADEEEKRSMMGRIVAGIESNKWNKMMKSEEPTTEIQKKLSPAMAALAGWWFGGDVQGIARGMSEPSAAQQREFERQVQRQMRRGIKKASALEELQTHYSDASDTYIRRTPVQKGVQADEVDVQKASGGYMSTSSGGTRLSVPPRPGEQYNNFTHRWEKPENMTQHKVSQQGKARLARTSGVGAMERSVGGHGKGAAREAYKGKKGTERGERLSPEKIEETKRSKSHASESKKKDTRRRHDIHDTRSR